MATVSGSASTTTRNPRHWQLAILVMATLPKFPMSASISFDHLVSEREQLVRYGEAEHPGGLVVDHQFHFRHLHYRQVRRSCALEDAANIGADLKIRVDNV